MIARKDILTLLEHDSSNRGRLDFEKCHEFNSTNLVIRGIRVHFFHDYLHTPTVFACHLKQNLVLCTAKDS